MRACIRCAGLQKHQKNLQNMSNKLHKHTKFNLWHSNLFVFLIFCQNTRMLWFSSTSYCWWRSRRFKCAALCQSINNPAESVGAILHLRRNKRAALAYSNIRIPDESSRPGLLHYPEIHWLHRKPWNIVLCPRRLNPPEMIADGLWDRISPGSAICRHMTFI